LAQGGTVKARAFINQMTKSSDVISEKFDICPVKWKVIDFDTEDPNYPAGNAIDGDDHTMWHTPWTGDARRHPHHITIDFTETLTLKGFTYSPRTDSNKSGTVLRFDLMISLDGNTWRSVINGGSFSNMRNNPIKQWVYFGQEYKARYLKFISLEGIRNEPWMSAGEIGIITK
jgi:alpha-L-fucosidase